MTNLQDIFERINSTITYHIILSQPRSGSTYFAQLLSSHPCVINVEERVSIKSDMGKKKFTTSIKDAVQKFTPSEPQKCNMGEMSIGCKNMINTEKTVFQGLYEGVDKHGLQNFLVNTQTRLVLMLRGNALERYVSLFGNSALKLPLHCKSGGKACPKNKKKSLHIDIPKLTEFVKQHSDRQQKVIAALEAVVRSTPDLDILYVSYERLLVDREEVMTTALRFLGIEPTFSTSNVTTGSELSLQANVKKRVTMTMPELISNWDHVEIALRPLCASCDYSEGHLKGVPKNMRRVRSLRSDARDD